MSLITMMVRRRYGILTLIGFVHLLSLSLPSVSGNGQLFSGTTVPLEDDFAVNGPAETVVHTPRLWFRCSSMLSLSMTTDIVFLMVPGGGGLLGDEWT